MKKAIVSILLLGLVLLVGCMQTEYRAKPTYDDYCQSVGFEFARYTGGGAFDDYPSFECRSNDLTSQEIFGNEYQSGYYFIDQVHELGQSICDQEYKMDFDYYFEKTLHCKPKVQVQTKKYDGIQVNIGEIED